MCCSPNREAVRAAIQYHTRAWQTLRYTEKNVISSLLYTFLSSTSSPKLFYSIICKNVHRNIKYNEFTPDRRQSKTSILSTNVYRNGKKTEFLIAISCMTGDNWQSKTLVVAISDPRLLFAKSYRLPHIRYGNIFFYNRNMKNVNYS